MKHIVVLCTLLILVLGCSNQQAPPILSEESATLARKAQIEDLLNSGPIMLSGTHNYYTYASKTKEVLQDADVPADATLTSLGGQNIRLEVKEHLGEVDREFVLEGKITPGGIVKLNFVIPPPEVLLGIVQDHSGCTVSGPIAVYHGSFDGEKFYALMIFKSQCPVEWPANEVFDTPVDGPVHWQWTMKFTMVQ